MSRKRALPKYVPPIAGGVSGYVLASLLMVWTGSTAADAFGQWWLMIVFAVVFIGVGLLIDYWTRGDAKGEQ